jgi:hypothetical protein
MLQALTGQDISKIADYEKMEYEKFLLFLHSSHNYVQSQNTKMKNQRGGQQYE